MRTAKPGYNPPLKLQVEFGRSAAATTSPSARNATCSRRFWASAPEGDFNYRHFADTFYDHYQSRPYNEFALRAFYKDGRFRVVSFIVESFMRSQCVQKGGAHCGHCHDFHPSDINNERDLKFLDHPDQMCLQCHPCYAANLEAHTHHPAASAGKPLHRLPHAQNHDHRDVQNHDPPLGRHSQRRDDRTLRPEIQPQRLPYLPHRQRHCVAQNRIGQVAKHKGESLASTAAVKGSGQ